MAYDETYFRTHISGWHQMSRPAIERFVEDTLGARHDYQIIDFGCGDGAYGSLLRGHSKWLAGVDVSADGITQARSLGVYDDLASGDLASRATLGSLRHGSDYDVVFSTEVIEHVEDVHQFLATARAALRQNGLLVLTTTMYYHYLFHALLVHRSALRGFGWLDYLAGFVSEHRRRRFVRRFWEYSGGHFHGFSKRILVKALRANGFELKSFEWMHAGQLVPTHSLTQERERFAQRGRFYMLAATPCFLWREG